MKALFFCRYSMRVASSRVRGFYVAEKLRDFGVSCRVVWGGSPWAYLKFSVLCLFYEVIVFQKHYTCADVLINRVLRRFGKATVFDIDDAPFGVKGRERTMRQVVKMIKSCSGTMVASHELCLFAEKYTANSVIVPTGIQTQFYKPVEKKSDSRDITVGWIGNGPGYRHDIEMALETLDRLAVRYRMRLMVVGVLGDKDLHERLSDMKNLDVEIIDDIEWDRAGASAEMIGKFDIGIYPLLETDYNKYKGGFKGLEYMAMEVPVVASAVGENKYIIQHGKTGFLVERIDQWEQCLQSLIEDTGLRRQMGKAGRQRVQEDYSMEVCAEKISDMFRKVLVQDHQDYERA